MTIPPGWYPDPETAGAQRFWDGDGWTEQRTPAVAEPVQPPADAQLTAPPPTAAFETRSPEPSSPLFSGLTGPPPAADDHGRGRLIMNYAIGVAVGLALVVATALWAALGSPSRSDTNISGPSVSSSLARPTESAGVTADEETQPTSGTRPSRQSGEEIVNAGLSFTVESVEFATNVTSPANEYLTTDAAGKFVIVRLSIVNVGNETQYYLAAQQRLMADGTAYEPDQPTSYFLGNIFEELAPGAAAQTSVVFDIPADATPASLELHGDAVSAGSVIPLR